MTRRGLATSRAAVFVGVGLLFGCAGPKGKAAAEKAVVVFHDQLDRGEFVKIYADTHPDFKKQTPEKDFVLALESIHRTLGKTVSAHQAGWRVGTLELRAIVQLTYETKFTGGDAVETFNFCIDGSNALLLGYVGTPQVPITK